MTVVVTHLFKLLSFFSLIFAVFYSFIITLSHLRYCDSAFQNFIRFNICCSTPNFVKIGIYFHWDRWFNDFQNGGRTPSWILKICSFCHMAFVGMPFCKFLVQNFAEIRKSVDELRPKKRFSRWRPPKSWIFKNFNFWSRDYSICYMYRISSKSDNFSLRYGDLTIFKMAAVRHLDFYTFAFFVP